MMGEIAGGILIAYVVISVVFVFWKFIRWVIVIGALLALVGWRLL